MNIATTLRSVLSTWFRDLLSRGTIFATKVKNIGFSCYSVWGKLSSWLCALWLVVARNWVALANWSCPISQWTQWMWGKCTAHQRSCHSKWIQTCKELSSLGCHKPPHRSCIAPNSMDPWSADNNSSREGSFSLWELSLLYNMPYAFNHTNQALNLQVPACYEWSFNENSSIQH